MVSINDLGFEESTPPVTDEKAKADALERSKRTFKQGLIAVILSAVTTALLQVVGSWTNNDFISSASWIVLGTSVLQAVIVAVASYVNRFTNTPVHTY